MPSIKDELRSNISKYETILEDLKGQLAKLEESDFPNKDELEVLDYEFDNISEEYFGSNKSYAIKVKLSGSFKFDFDNVKNWSVSSDDIELREYDTPEASLDIAVEEAVVSEKIAYTKAVNKWLAKVKKVAKKYNLTDKEMFTAIF